MTLHRAHRHGVWSGAPHPGAVGIGTLPRETFGRTFGRNFGEKFVFGFLDNFLMIVAGEAIDKHVTKLLPRSMDATRRGMAVAGLGNTVSDAAGVGVADRLMAMVAEMTPALQPRGIPHADGSLWGGVAGITAGCLVGLTAGMKAKWPTLVLLMAAAVTVVAMHSRWQQRFLEEQRARFLAAQQAGRVAHA